MNLNEHIAESEWDTDITRRKLEALPALVTQLPDALLARRTDSSRAQIVHSPAPLNLEAARLLDERVRYDWTDGMASADPHGMGVQPYLRSWVLDLEADLLDAEQAGADAPTSETVAASVSWLLEHLDFISWLPQWPEFAWGIDAAHRSCASIVGPIVGRAKQDPWCSECHVGRFMRDGAKAQWTCDHCDRVATIRLTTIPEASEQLNIGTGTLYAWAKEGRFDRVRHEGVWLYDFSQLAIEAARLRLTKPERTPGRPVKKQDTPTPSCCDTNEIC